MMACAHKHTEKSTKLLLTTAGDCSLGKHCTQMFNDTDGVRKRSNPVERPQVHCEFFGTAGVIDHVNSQTGHELRLYQEWPAKTFWKKLFVCHEGCVLADMCPQHRENKVLESMQETGRTETIVEFPDRLLLSIKPIKRSGLGVPASPAPGTPVSSPVSPRRPAMPGMIRGKRRSNVLDDGDHCHRRGSPTKVVRRTTSATGTWQKVQRKSCLVCKAQGTRMNDKNKNFPQTQSQRGTATASCTAPTSPATPTAGTTTCTIRLPDLPTAETWPAGKPPVPRPVVGPTLISAVKLAALVLPMRFACTLHNSILRSHRAGACPCPPRGLGPSLPRRRARSGHWPPRLFYGCSCVHHLSGNNRRDSHVMGS